MGVLTEDTLLHQEESNLYKDFIQQEASWNECYQVIYFKEGMVTQIQE